MEGKERVGHDTKSLCQRQTDSLDNTEGEEQTGKTLDLTV